MWEIGMIAVAIKDHAQGVFSKGDEFIVQGIKQGCCGFLLLNLSICNANTLCPVCNNRVGVDWWGAQQFRPKTEAWESADISELMEVLKEETAPVEAGNGARLQYLP